MKMTRISEVPCRAEAADDREEAEPAESRGSRETSGEDFYAGDERLLVHGEIDAGDFVVLHLNDARLRKSGVRAGGDPGTEGDDESGDGGTAKREGEKRSGWFHDQETITAESGGLLRRTACRHACRA